MKAITINRYGADSALNFTDAEVPTPKLNEVTIKVVAAAVNPVDWKIRDGLGEIFGLRPPFTLGCEVAGILEEVGEGVAEFQVGDEVYCYLGSHAGGYAQYVAAPSSEVSLKPSNLDFDHAAAVPVGALTAWQAIFDLADLQSGQTILIHAAAGGVGSMAVQIAKAKGAFVIGTASGKNRDFVKSLGADEFVDYTNQKFEEVVQDADVVFDTIGGDTQQRSFAVLKKGGFLVTSVSPPSQESADGFGVQANMVNVEPNAEQLAQITQLIESGQIVTRVETTLPLSKAQQAIALSEAGHTQGKIILHP